MTYEADCMERDSHRCFRCPRWLGLHWPGYSCHHRQTRAVGPDTLDNRIMLCGSGTTGCHGWVHAHPAEAREHGWIVSRYVSDPAEVPVLHWQRGLVYLTTDGRYSEVPPSERK